MTGFVPPNYAPRITVRDVNEDNTGQLATFSEADFVPRWNGVGSWRVKLAANTPGAELFVPGCGISAVMPDGFLFTGQMTDYRKTKNNENPGGTVEASGVEDNALLGFRVVYPTPTVAVNLQTATATYNATGPAQTVMHNLVALNIGPAAPLSFRRITNLRQEQDQGLGPTSPVSLRFDNLLEVHQRVMSPAGLGFTIKAEPGGYVYQVHQARDLSLDVIFAEEKGNLSGYEYTLKSPGLTRGIVAGQGEGTARNISMYNDPTIPSLETTWGWVIEQFLDRRDTNVTAELQQAATEAFAQQNNQYSLTIETLDTPDIQFGRDYMMGDKVSVRIDGVTYTDTITQVLYEFRPDSYRQLPSIGNAEAVGGRALDIYRVVRLIASRVGLLEKRF